MVKPEVVVVPCGPLEADDTLSLDCQLRVEAGIDLAVSQQIPWLIMTGRGARTMGTAARRNINRLQPELTGLGRIIPYLLVEDESRDTIGNAHFTKREYLSDNDWRDIALVTADYHIPRAIDSFDRVLGPDFCLKPFPVPMADVYRPEHLARLERREKYQGWIGQLILAGIEHDEDNRREDRLLRWHPRYAGSRTSFLLKLLERPA